VAKFSLLTDACYLATAQVFNVMAVERRQ